jgi:hypothetical protein
MVPRSVWSIAARASQRYARAPRRIYGFAGPFDLGVHVGVDHATGHDEIDWATEDGGQFVPERKKS